MKKECLVHLKSWSDNDPQGQEIWASGKCYERTPGVFQVLYETFEEEDEKAVPTPEKMTKHRLKIAKDRLDVEKYGPNSTILAFAEGLAHETNYQTPFGVLEMVFETRHFQVDVKENELRVTLRYHIHMNGTKASENQMNIVISSEE